MTARDAADQGNRTSKIATAMVLAAGMGNRMRPLTDRIPKPLVSLSGRPLIDHVLDRLMDAGIGRAVVNVHYKADLIESHLRDRQDPEIILSDERDALLDTGGGVVRALPKIGHAAFLVHNSDSVWIEHGAPVLAHLIASWNPDEMDVLMLLADPTKSLGYSGRGDFNRDASGLISRPADNAHADFVFAGVSITKPTLLDGMPSGAFSLNVMWNKAIAQKRVYGVVLDGLWMHVGTPAALEDAEATVKAHAQAQQPTREHGA